jgi:hypothetical protein
MNAPRTVTVVLVHGAFAEPYSNWKLVLESLFTKGYKVVAPPTASTIAAALVEINPGGMREMHRRPTVLKDLATKS